MMLTLEEYMHKRGTTGEQQARINTHKRAMLLMQEYPALPQISNEYE